MGARNVTESTVTMIRDLIKANIAQALADVRAERVDAKVSTEIPKDYFLYERAHAYKTPAIFVIARGVDLLKRNGPNAIMANVKVTVSVVVEDKTADNLTLKAFRYQDALFEVLDQAQIVSNDGDVKIVVVVQEMMFSPTFTMDTDPKTTTNTFRKEVVLECDVAHFEQP